MKITNGDPIILTEKNLKHAINCLKSEQKNSLNEENFNKSISWLKALERLRGLSDIEKNRIAKKIFKKFKKTLKTLI